MTINEFQKYPTDKKKWDKNWLRIFGVKCPVCMGWGIQSNTIDTENEQKCPKCNGNGFVEREKR